MAQGASLQVWSTVQGHSSTVEYRSPKPRMRVRFLLPLPIFSKHNFVCVLEKVGAVELNPNNKDVGFAYKFGFVSVSATKPVRVVSGTNIPSAPAKKLNYVI